MTISPRISRAVCTLACVAITAAPSIAQGQQARRPGGTSPGSELPQAFSVVLVTGEMAGDGSIADNVPTAVKRALTDMRDFLPYRHYRLLDTAWIQGSGSDSAITTRLSGDGREYQLTLGTLAAPPVNTSGTSPRRVTIKFTLASSRAETATPRSSLARQLEELESRYVTARRKLEDLDRRGMNSNHPDMMMARRTVEDLRSAMGLLEARLSDSSRSEQATTLIDTVFTMNLGETVVVGTSRVRDSIGLLALLTAVPNK